MRMPVYVFVVCLYVCIHVCIIYIYICVYVRVCACARDREEDRHIPHLKVETVCARACTYVRVIYRQHISHFYNSAETATDSHDSANSIDERAREREKDRDIVIRRKREEPSQGFLCCLTLAVRGVNPDLACFIMCT